MANDNETVKDLCDVLYANPKAEVCDGSGITVLHNDKIADRILAAHEREMAANDAEIVRLRALVKELANELDLKTCHTVCDLYCTKCYQKDCEDLENRALIAKAREVCK